MSKKGDAVESLEAKPLLLESEYLDDLESLYKIFASEATIGPNGEEQVAADMALIKLIFEALGKPLTDQNVRSMETESEKLGIVGVSYPMFEREFKKKFPYDSKKTLEEVINFFTQGRDALTLDDLIRVSTRMQSEIPQEELANVIKVLGTDGKIPVSEIRTFFT